MRYRISQIKLNINDIECNNKVELLENAISKKKKLNSGEISEIEIVRESLDSRRKPDLKYVYTVDFNCERRLDLPLAKKKEYVPPVSINTVNDRKQPVIVGFGPCGMFCGLIMAQAGLKPLILERGEDVENRIKTVDKFWSTGELNCESNVQFGEGGAGTFSDGKLTTGIKDIRISKVLKELVKAGADENILYRHKPHIGTDKLRSVVRNIRNSIIEMGGTVKFNTRLDDIIVENGRVSAVVVDNNVKRETIETEVVVVAVGHSSRDTFKLLYEKGINMKQKPFSMGLRVSHLQEMINRAQYGDASLAEKVGAADYKLSHKCRNGRGVYTFCMCPGGDVVNASSEPETAVTNGMSNSKRDGKYANSGLLVDVRTDDFNSEHPLAGVEFQRKYEKMAFVYGKGKLPATTYEQFKNNKNDIVKNSLPEFVGDAIIEAMPFFGNRLKGFDNPDALFIGVETRSSSPVRMLRDDGFQSNITGIYPAGEGAGYAGGIVSAAVDGIKIAEQIILQG